MVSTLNTYSKTVVAVVVIVALGFSSVGSWAQLYDPTGDIPAPTGLEKAMTKLGRGISNVLLGWGEIPLSFDDGVKKDKPFAYVFCVAPVLGASRAFMRTTTGVFEVVTFPFSDRDVNYKPILEPEYVF